MNYYTSSLYSVIICISRKRVQTKYYVLVNKQACVLHNFVRRRDGYNFKDTLTQYFEDLPFNSPPQSTNRGKTRRDNFAEYFKTPAGELSYQNSERVINP